MTTSKTAPDDTSGAGADAATPSVFDFLDYRAFLRAWLDWKREVMPSYTFGIFGKQARLSRAVLPNALEGRREPTSATLDGFARAMRLDADEREFLGLLVDLKRVSSLDENGRLLRRVFGHSRYAGGQVVDTRQLEVLTSWERIAVLEASKLPGFEPKVDWLLERLRPAVSREDLAEALEVLQVEGLIARASEDEGGASSPRRLHTPAEVEGIAAYRIHQSYLDAAKDALQQVPWDERNFGVLGMTVPREAVPDVLAEVQAFVERMRELSDGYGEAADTVVQLNVQSWVVTAEVDET